MKVVSFRSPPNCEVQKSHRWAMLVLRSTIGVGVYRAAPISVTKVYRPTSLALRRRGCRFSRKTVQLPLNGPREGDEIVQCLPQMKLEVCFALSTFTVKWRFYSNSWAPIINPLVCVFPGLILFFYIRDLIYDSSLICGSLKPRTCRMQSPDKHQMEYDSSLNYLAISCM